MTSGMPSLNRNGTMQYVWEVQLSTAKGFSGSVILPVTEFIIHGFFLNYGAGSALQRPASN